MTTVAPLISVIIPTYNRCEMLAGALETLARQERRGVFNVEIVVIDNASSDATRDIVERAAQHSAIPIRYFYHEVPGPAPARNRGLTESQGEWLAFFDDDELAPPDWLYQLYLCATDNKALVVGGAMQLDLPQATLDRVGKVVRTTLLREIDYYPRVQRFCKKRLPGTNNALVSRRVFNDLGGFDTSKTGAGSDSDFFLRARQAGIALWYRPAAIVRHRVAEHRLTPEYFRWDAQQGSSAFAALDHKFKGATMMSLLCILRLCHAIAFVLPRLFTARLRKNSGAIMDQRVRLWRTEAYVRTTLSLLAPTWFPQDRYFSDLQFRRGRVVGHQAMPAETLS